VRAVCVNVMLTSELFHSGFIGAVQRTEELRSFIGRGNNIVIGTEITLPGNYAGAKHVKEQLSEETYTKCLFCSVL